MKRILVVDDETDVLDLTSIVLSEEGYQVEQAHDGREALGMLESSAPDLILLDLRMPHLSGPQFMARYRTNGISGPPVILMTASSRPREEAAEIGASGWIAKPFDLNALVDTVKEHLSK